VCFEGFALLRLLEWITQAWAVWRFKLRFIVKRQTHDGLINTPASVTRDTWEHHRLILLGHIKRTKLGKSHWKKCSCRHIDPPANWGVSWKTLQGNRSEITRLWWEWKCVCCCGLKGCGCVWEKHICHVNKTINTWQTALDLFLILWDYDLWHDGENTHFQTVTRQRTLLSANTSRKVSQSQILFF